MTMTGAARAEAASAAVPRSRSAQPTLTFVVLIGLLLVAIMAALALGQIGTHVAPIALQCGQIATIRILFVQNRSANERGGQGAILLAR